MNTSETLIHIINRFALRSAVAFRIYSSFSFSRHSCILPHNFSGIFWVVAKMLSDLVNFYGQWLDMPVPNSIRAFIVRTLDGQGCSPDRFCEVLI